MNEQPGPSGDERGVTGSGPVSRQRWRTIVAVLLIVIGCVLAPLAGVAVWTRNQVTNTDRYVRTVAPLASDPAIQQAVADQITAKIFTYLDVQGLTNQASAPQVADRLRGFAGPLSSGIQSFVRTEVDKIVQSQAFADAWVQANRVAHQALVRALTAKATGRSRWPTTPSASTWPPSSRRASSGWSTPGSTWPPGSLRSTPPSSCSTSRTSPAHKPHSTCSTPWGSGCRSSPSCCSGPGSRWACSGCVALSLAVFRTIYLDAVPAAVLPHAAAAAAYDTIVAYLRLGLRSVLVLGLAVAAGAVLTGPSPSAVRTRQRLAAAMGRLRGGAGKAGLRTGPVGTWVDANKQLLRIGAVTLAVLALVFWGQPTAKVILLLAGLLLVALALIEFLAQPPQPAAAPTTRT